MSVPQVLLILGHGGNIGAATAKLFAAQNFKVAIASRSLKAGTSEEGYLTIPADFSQPASVKDAFAATREAFGTPTVVLYNCSSGNPVPDPFSIAVEDFASHLAVNVTSPFAAAQEALSGLETLTSGGRDLTFLYTGNALNRMIIPSLLAGGAGKSATAHWIQIGAQLYKDKGAKFYYVDERTADGGVAGSNLDGPAHAEEFLRLVEGMVQEEPLDTFVKGKGYVKFY
ncbi:hypothetical protein RQP46_008771 [Phenoliferia psychrophenolica]